MFVSGVVVVLVVMGLSSATRPFLKLDLWLDQRESPVTAQANALSPIIACVNRVDVHWRNAYDKFERPRPTSDAFGHYLAEARDFDNTDAYTVQDIQKDLCLSHINEKLELLAYQPVLSQKVRDYAQALQGGGVDLYAGATRQKCEFLCHAARPVVTGLGANPGRQQCLH
jgi:hypothetical protein